MTNFKNINVPYSWSGVNLAERKNVSKRYIFLTNSKQSLITEVMQLHLKDFIFLFNSVKSKLALIYYIN